MLLVFNIKFQKNACILYTYIIYVIHGSILAHEVYKYLGHSTKNFAK